MSHASLRMIVHVATASGGPSTSSPPTSSARRSCCPQVAGDIRVAFTLTEPDAGTGADLRCEVVQRG